jgi:hypothetical protein
MYEIYCYTIVSYLFSIFIWQFLYPIGHFTLYRLMECNKWMNEWMMNEWKIVVTYTVSRQWFLLSTEADNMHMQSATVYDIQLVGTCVQCGMLNM